METYQGYINEFVDWVTGEDTSELELPKEKDIIRASSTNGVPVSGGSIRELIQKHLKNPFVYYEDTTAGLYRLFSSESTKNKWIAMNTPGSAQYDPDTSKALELFNFERPADTVMTYAGINNSPKYIIYGDTESEAAELQFNVYLSKEQGGGTVYESDSFTITYTILDADGNMHTDVVEYRPEYLNSAQKVHYNIYKYLSVGKNEVTVSMKAKNSSAKNSINFSVYMLQFELSSTFAYNNHWQAQLNIEIPVSVKRSNANLTLTVDVFIDGEYARFADQDAATTWLVSSNELNPSRTFVVLNTYAPNVEPSDHIRHTLRIQASMYDSSNQTTFYSNVLFYDFVVASSTVGLVNKFINTAYSVNNDKVSIDVETNKVVFNATQYEPFELKWSYYTDQLQSEQSIPVTWQIRTGEVNDYTYKTVAVGTGINGQVSETLRFIPDTAYSASDNAYLLATYNNNVIEMFPLVIALSRLNITETGFYNLKLSAYGKSNAAPDKNQWVDSTNNIRTDFVNVAFDTNAGWNDNSFVVSGVDSYALVNYCPFPQGYETDAQGKTIEIEFKTENVVNKDDVVIRIGHVENAHIDITSDSATFYSGNSPKIHTNFKSNERIKLAFIFNKTSISAGYDSGLIYIVNNGILERAASMGSTGTFVNNSGKIKIGGSASGVRVYMIRAYDRPITYTDEMNNFIFDSENKAELVGRNNIMEGADISYDLCKGKIDIFNIEGDLDKILAQGSLKEESESTVTFSRECISDESKSFTVVNGKIRKHGQSTLNYPITSLKIWTNKAKENNVVPEVTFSPVQVAEGLNKNRYIMKTGAIPANKFVLQANYADSSGVHNGGLLRLIQNTWFNALIGGEYKLRTAPQLFTTNEVIHHDNENLHEDGSWTEGYGNVTRSLNKLWGDFTSRDFPYTIRVAADSFPCAVFYKNTGANGDGKKHFLGQYVFMDDKKSDYTYGERSIYFFGNGTDPFVLRTENTKNGPNGKQDTAENCVWDNKDVLRIEVVLPNQKLTSYMDFNVPATVVRDEHGEIIEGGATVPCTNIKEDENHNPLQYYWEDYFEMIYPDGDDVAEDDAKNGLDKFSPNSKFVRKVQPFVDFLRWITDCKNNYNTATDWWSAGTYSSTQQAFENTAKDHLDLYKVAAYYIFFLRFGLVDSVERNAQLKTYDGQHWHYEPWDMDIALGNTNQGQLIFDPPIDRTSLEPGTTTYAFSGKSLTTSNVLWDCLESWDYWANTLVPDVAQALYSAGLTYDNIIRMFDGEYSDKWPEAMYNESGYFKYIESGGADWLPWLQGSRESHRHWWVSTSMNYYDAKWSCGSFNEHRVRIFADKDIHNVDNTDVVTIAPTADTFFKFTAAEGKTNLGTLPASKNSPAQFDISRTGFSAKDPSYIYGGTFIESIDLSCFAEKLKAADFSLCYDDVLGAPIKSLNVGTKYTETSSTEYAGKVSGTLLRLTGYDTAKKVDAFANLRDIDITGQYTIKNTLELLSTRDRKNVQNFYAIGTGITEFASAPSGNRFNTIKLPATTIFTESGQPDVVDSEFSSIIMENSSWNTIEFWNTSRTNDVTYVRDENDQIVLDENNEPVLESNPATFTKTTVPASMRELQFKGSTAQNKCSLKLLLDWIDSIDASLPVGHTEADLQAVLANKVFRAQNIYWVSDNEVGISYNDLSRIACFNLGANRGGNLVGYIMISDSLPLTSVQLSNLKSWFGDSVFDKGAINSGLVIDLNTSYVQISVGGPHVDTTGGTISLQEGKYATLNATKFLLSEDTTNYVWSVGIDNDFRVDSIRSVRFEDGNDGVKYLVADEGDYGNYTVTVKVSYVDPFSGLSTLNQVDINIIGVTYPNQIKISARNINNQPARPFLINATLASQFNLFRSGYDNLAYNGQELNDCYVLYAPNQAAEFYLDLINNPGHTSSATLKSVIYYVTTFTLSRETLAQSDSTLNAIVPGQFYYSCDAINGGIVLHTGSTLPSSMTLYQVTCEYHLGGRSAIKKINVILYDDNSIILQNTGSTNILYSVISDKYNTAYGQPIGANVYKSHLISVLGDLDFTQYPTIQDLRTITNESVFLYLPNVTALDFSGCTQLTRTIANNLNQFIFDNMYNLTSLNFSGCLSMTGELDLSGCPALLTFVSTDTNLGVKFPANTIVQTVQLGSPVSIYLNSPTLIGTTGTLTVLSSSNLDSVVLINVNQSATKGFNLFDSIYTLAS